MIVEERISENYMGLGFYVVLLAVCHDLNICIFVVSLILAV